jgi:catalase
MTGALADADRRVSDKMVELCTSCDADWGQRLADSLAKARSGNAAGATQANESQNAAAVAQAEAVAHDAKPY